MIISASLPMFTMRSYKENGIPYTVTTLETNMSDKGKRLTHYQVNIMLPTMVKTLMGYSSQHHMDAFSFAKRRGRNWINKTIS